MMKPEDLSALKTYFTFSGILKELSNKEFTDNLSDVEKSSISNLITICFSEAKHYTGDNKDIKKALESMFETFNDLKRFNPELKLS